MTAHLFRFALTFVLLAVVAWFAFALWETLTTMPAGVSL